MPQYSQQQSDCCCINGQVACTCGECGAHPRMVLSCKFCQQTGTVWSPCSRCTTPRSSGYYASGYTSHSGGTDGYSGGSQMRPSGGQESYGSRH